MSIGFVYILLNPAFPRQIKIGRTRTESHKRAKELSRQTGVPHDFILIYDEMVNDAEEVERLMHEKFAEFRVFRHKEFFYTTPKDAIKSLQEIAARFPASPNTPSLQFDLMEYFLSQFSTYLDPSITGIRLVQLPGICYLEVARLIRKKHITKREDIPLWGIETPDVPSSSVLEANATRLKSLDAYDWIMISDLFPGDVAQKIADEWQQSGGLLDQRREKSDQSNSS